MPDLIAQGPERRHRWRRRLPATDEVLLVGRDAGPWSVTWDPCISRRQVRLQWRDGRLRVERDAAATNPIYVRGQRREEFDLRLDEHFVVGDTRFTLVGHEAHVTVDAPRPVSQRTFSADDLRHLEFRNARRQIRALTRLPEIVASARTNAELNSRLIELLLTGIANASAAALVRYRPTASSSSNESLEVMHWDRVDAASGEFQPSAPLIRSACVSGENVIHFWDRDTSSSASATLGEFDWAFCSPIPGDACAGQAIYVAGLSPPDQSRDTLEDALKLVDLVGTTVGSVCDVRRLEKQATALAQFFSAPVRAAVAAADVEVALVPREADLTVMFCDLRGFSRRSERAAADDDLLGLLQRVSEALGIVTHRILEHGGVIGDFHGDAAMGFWGWPMQDAESVVHACRAAIEIHLAFQDAAIHNTSALADFRVGLGLATGPAVAGKIGTVDQVKVTAFGPVVNLASRLEGLTRRLGLPMLVDATTAHVARTRLPAHLASVRPLCAVRPYGMDTPYELFELAPARQVPWATDPAADAWYQDACQAFRSGDWPRAEALLVAWSPDDPVRNFFLNWIRAAGGQAPPDWQGVIEFPSK